MKINVDIIKNCKEWQVHKGINKALIKKITENIIKRFSNLAQIKNIELAILLTDNPGILELNKKFRNIAKATNTLSFPDIELNWRHLLEFQPNLDYMYLGDIAFGYEIIRQEALDQQKVLEDHFIHLLIHSILHLIGFDHQNDEEAELMENLEIKILKDFNIASPYIN